jgi:hypothetical protein
MILHFAQMSGCNFVDKLLASVQIYAVISDAQ